jgi:hypothetical protein
VIQSSRTSAGSSTFKSTHGQECFCEVWASIRVPRRVAIVRYIDRDEVARRLTYEVCMPLVRDAMIAFSTGVTRQLLRSIIPLADGHLFGIMPGALGINAPFGAKLLSIFPENTARGLQSHGGMIVLFEPEAGAAVCCVHAGEVTAIRTAAASAVATDALARSKARRLAILGYGEQAATHARAISKVRRLESITVWGRSLERARAFAESMRSELGIPVTAASNVKQAVAEADIICTLTWRMNRSSKLPGWRRARTSTSSVQATLAPPRSTTRWSLRHAFTWTAARACSPRAQSSCAPNKSG